MDANTFINYYKELPTKADQKLLRQRILAECKIKKTTFYSWLDRGDVPDEKALLIIADIIKQ